MAARAHLVTQTPARLDLGSATEMVETPHCHERKRCNMITLSPTYVGERAG